MPLKHVRRGLRALRSAWYRWTPDRDRIYHDTLFEAQQLDPFRWSYPGYVTIRRFADLTEPYVPTPGRVLDLGCGTGEITCELARRFPDTRFEGVDHSEAGVRRARQHAVSLKLPNVAFHVADVERHVPEGPVDLITMFDAFHHVTQPAAFLAQMGAHSSRFLLIEPRGDWKGSWAREMNFDWLAADLDRIRARLAAATGEPEPDPGESHPGAEEREEPIEYRYAIEDFEQFFAGYGFEVRGTVAGLEVYPPTPELASASRERFGQLTYDLYAEIDELLHTRELDLLAKHLVIYAERGRDVPRRAVPSRPAPDADSSTGVRGAHDVQYLAYDGPHETQVGQELLAQVRLRNESWRRWTSEHPTHPDLLSYHWLDAQGNVVFIDGIRTSLPHVVVPGEEVDVALKVRALDTPGRYQLAVDMVQESTTWFSDAGSPCLKVPVRIRR